MSDATPPRTPRRDAAGPLAYGGGGALLFLAGAFGATFLLITAFVDAWFSKTIALLVATVALFTFALWACAVDQFAPERWTPKLRRARLVLLVLVALVFVFSRYDGTIDTHDLMVTPLVIMFGFLLPHPPLPTARRKRRDERPAAGVSPLLLATAFVAATGGEAHAQEPAQERASEPARLSQVHEDRDYCFRITAPDRTWRLLDEAAARKLADDAVAGMTDLRGTFWVVKVLPLGAETLDDVTATARATLESVLEEAALGAVDPSPFGELPARRWETTGSSGGLATRFRHLHVARGGFCYQLFGWQAAAAAQIHKHPADLDALAHHFEMTEGEPRVRTYTAPPFEARGVGWRVEAGVYRDAVRGIEIRPADGWRLLVGDALAAIDDAAFVGLEAEGAIELALYDDPVPGAVAAEREAAMRADYEQIYGAPLAGEPIAASIAGLDFAIRAWGPSEARDLRSHHGVRVAGGRALQVVVWYAGAMADRASALLPAAFASITAMEPAARAALAAALVVDGDPESAIGRDFSLRRGVYRDFARGFTWTKPAGWWELDLTAEEDDDAILRFRELATGLTGMVQKWEAGEATLEEFHRSLVERLEPMDPIPPPTPVDLDGVAALATELRPGYLDEPHRWTVVTAKRDGIAYELAIRAPEALYDAARAQVVAATTALRLPARLVAGEWVEGSYVDCRLGFRFDPPGPEKWRGRVATPTALEPIASMTHFQRDGVFVYVGAVESIDDDFDDGLLRDLVLQSLARPLPMGEREPVESAATLGGWPATKLAFGNGRRISGWFAHRGRSFRYVFVSTARDEELDRYAACFRSLDD